MKKDKFIANNACVYIHICMLHSHYTFLGWPYDIKNEFKYLKFYGFFWGFGFKVKNAFLSILLSNPLDYLCNKIE